MTSRIPPLLSSHLRLPPRNSVTLLTSTLGACANWLIIRYLYSSLVENSAVAVQDGLDTERGHINVVLVSWMRDWEFWRAEARKSVGLDLARLQEQGHFAFVDGLTDLFAPEKLKAGILSASPSKRSPTPTFRPTNRAPVLSQEEPLESPQANQLKSSSLFSTFDSIISAISVLRASTSTLLILDTPHLLLSTDGYPSAQPTTSLLLKLRSNPLIHATIVAAPADTPLFRANTAATPEGTAQNGLPSTSLEIANTALTVSLLHQARLVLGTRELQTGWAGDVSGIVSVAKGGGWSEFKVGDSRDRDVATWPREEVGEWLYRIGWDGGVRVWSRGEGQGDTVY